MRPIETERDGSVSVERKRERERERESEEKELEPGLTYPNRGLTLESLHGSVARWRQWQENHRKARRFAGWCRVNELPVRGH